MGCKAQEKNRYAFIVIAQLVLLANC